MTEEQILKLYRWVNQYNLIEILDLVKAQAKLTEIDESDRQVKLETFQLIGEELGITTVDEAIAMKGIK